jgi:hypothetical protein
MQRKTLSTLLLLAVALGCLPSCSMAEGVAKTLSRTTQSLSRTVGNAGSAITR